MKTIKRISCLLLALALMMALSVTAFAANVTVDDNAILNGHSFTAYQVFTGREEGGILSDVEWGSGINADAFLAALKSDTNCGGKFTNCGTAAEVADVLGKNNTDDALANAVAKLAYANKTGNGTPLTAGENTLADGYYLIVDTTANVGAGGAYNAALLQVVGNINIKAKTDAPTVDKSVTDSNNVAGNAADYSIGDKVPFTLVGSVPKMDSYDTYKYIFHDTLSAGLTAPAKTEVKVYLSADKILDDDDTEVTTDFTVTVSGQEITVSCDDLKTVSGIAAEKYIIVSYSATLNSSANIGSEGNPNTVKLEYSNKPDQSGSGDTNNTGNTPEDKVLVFTYELDVTKVDGQNTETKLSGAEFVLLNSDKSKVAKVADGKLVEWVAVPAAVDGKITYPAGTTLTSGSDGKFVIAGLDAGSYFLREIKAPVGYNLIKNDISVTITATLNQAEEAPALTALTIKVDNDSAENGNVATGAVATDVKNNMGATLPETGGIGTTIFYVLGSVLLFGAAVLLITKKRMSAQK